MVIIIITKEGGEITLDTTDGLLNGTGKSNCNWRLRSQRRYTDY